MCAQFWCHEVLYRYITLGLGIPFWAVRCVLLRYHDMSVLSWTLPLRNILIMIEVWWWWWWCVQLQQPQLAPVPGPGPGCWDNVTTVVIIHVNIHNQTRSWSAAATVCKETSNKAKQSMNLTRRLQCAINQGMFEQLKGFFISLLMASITISIAVLARRVVFTGYSGIDNRAPTFWHRYYTLIGYYRYYTLIGELFHTFRNVFCRLALKYIVFTGNAFEWSSLDNFKDLCSSLPVE